MDSDLSSLTVDELLDVKRNVDLEIERRLEMNSNRRGRKNGKGRATIKSNEGSKRNSRQPLLPLEKRITLPRRSRSPITPTHPPTNPVTSSNNRTTRRSPAASRRKTPPRPVVVSRLLHSGRKTVFPSHGTKDEPTSTLLVTNIPEDASMGDVRDDLSRYGRILAIEPVRNESDEVLDEVRVRYSDPRDMQDALRLGTITRGRLSGARVMVTKQLMTEEELDKDIEDYQRRGY